MEYNTPVHIEYEGKIFKVYTKNFYDSIEATWRCEFYRRTKDLDADENRFCEAAIKGFKNIITKEFKFYLKMHHSEKCKVLKSKMKNSFINQYVNNNGIKTVNDSDTKKQNDIKNNKDSNIDNNKNYKNQFEIDEYILDLCKINKNLLDNKLIFIRQLRDLYDNNNIKIKKTI